MNREEIIQLRLFNQGLSAYCIEKPDEVVAHFGAIQAQDYSMALWAVGLRTKSSNQSSIENLINSGEIIRTHILRPTWHLVHYKDIRWMMELSAPNVKKATQYVNKQVGLTDELFFKAWKIIEQKFSEIDNLTKKDIMSYLSEQHLTVGTLLATQIIIRAELEMLMCNGEKKGTYAPFEKRVPKTDKISKSEAVIKLAELYFNSRGPATLKDFAWWSGLTMSDAKNGVAQLRPRLKYFTFNDLKYYYFEIENNVPEKTTLTLLPCYDEYTVGYSEGRDVVLPTDLAKSKIGNGIFKPLILSGKEIIGTWRKSKKSPFVEIQTFSDNEKIPTKNINEHIEKINIFTS